MIFNSIQSFHPSKTVLISKHLLAPSMRLGKEIGLEKWISETKSESQAVKEIISET